MASPRDTSNPTNLAEHTRPWSCQVRRRPRLVEPLRDGARSTCASTPGWAGSAVTDAPAPTMPIRPGPAAGGHPRKSR